MSDVIRSNFDDVVSLDITPESAGWEYSGLRVVTLAAGAAHTCALDTVEAMVIPLAGSCSVDVNGAHYALAGRANVFAGVPDVLYAPVGSTITISSAAGGRFAIATAKAKEVFPVRLIPADAIPVEYRGSGNCSRRVVNYGLPGVLDAHRIIAVEVFTPAGNWSSYPPHKHDEHSDTESELEEIYYFEVGDGPSGPGIGYQRVFGTPDRPIDVFAEVRTGDVVLVPHGWHGPSMAVPGYDLYYLNVMAGPERDWRICDHPDHAWIRGTWADQPLDPRVQVWSSDR
jgi:5-deoxy-glucuronate isomerase